MSEKAFSWRLVGLIGMGSSEKGYEEVTYEIDDELITEKFASIALSKKHYQKDPNGLIFLAFTPESEARYKAEIVKVIENQLPKAEFLPLVYDSNDVDGLLTKIFEAVNRTNAKDLIFDITNAFRSIPFVIFPEILFIKEHLESVRNVSTYYAKKSGAHFSFERLDTAAEIVEWSFAVNSFTRDGYSMPLANIFHRFYETLKTETEKERRFFSNFKRLSELFGSFHNAMRIADIREIGKIAKEIVDKIVSIRTNHTFGWLPYPWIAEKLLENMIPRLKSVATKEVGKNARIYLNDEELEREKRLALWYCEVQDEQNALQCVRELIVNTFMYYRSDSDWLSVSRRGEYEKQLSAPVALNLNTKSSPIIRTWDKIAQCRNFVSHCGLKEEKKPPFPREEIEYFLNSSIEEIFVLFEDFLQQSSEHEKLTD